MYLREKIDELNLLNQKIKELKNYIGGSLDEEQIDSVLKYLLKCMEDKQSIYLILNKLNSQTMLTIGSSKIDMSNAVIIRNTIKSKIDLISDMIVSNKLLDVIDLMKQRDGLLSEYNSINKAIRMADWSIQID